ncbi:pilus assembly protein [Kribbella sp. NBC_01245]|uniref:TadE/TadG family type IV pilus assembly protein n=1 Tax=Kribbella sp. NBC_01245 TaxID=2903578 RepID=UPI002E2B569C|nr:TadE/TadG family type IV pilus assembly protein [Kribbella sp. NBC_01245]
MRRFHLPAVRRARAGERGTMALELAILAPIMLMLFMFLMACGRYYQTASLLENAAREGARAASQARSSDDAEIRLNDAVDRAAGQAFRSCADTASGSITSGFEPGETLTVEVTCTIDYRDLGLLGLSGDTTVSRQFSSSVDPYRGVRDGSDG